MGIIAKGAKCNITGCENDAVRSITTSKVEESGMEVSSSGKKSALCKIHYKKINQLLI